MTKQNTVVTLTVIPNPATNKQVVVVSGSVKPK